MQAAQDPTEDISTTREDGHELTNRQLNYQILPSKGAFAFGPEEVALAEEEDDARGLPPRLKALLLP